MKTILFLILFIITVTKALKQLIAPLNRPINCLSPTFIFVRHDTLLRRRADKPAVSERWCEKEKLSKRAAILNEPGNEIISLIFHDFLSARENVKQQSHSVCEPSRNIASHSLFGSQPSYYNGENSATTKRRHFCKIVFAARKCYVERGNCDENWATHKQHVHTPQYSPILLQPQIPLGILTGSGVLAFGVRRSVLSRIAARQEYSLQLCLVQWNCYKFTGLFGRSAVIWSLQFG